MALIDINNRRSKHYTYSYIHVRTFTKTEPVSLSNPTMQPCLLAKPVAHSTASKFSAVLLDVLILDRIYIFNSVVATVPPTHAHCDTSM